MDKYSWWSRPYWTFPEGTEALMWVLSAAARLFINFCCCNLMVIIIIIFLGVIFVLDKPRKLSGQKSLGLKGPSTLRHHKMYLYIYIVVDIFSRIVSSLLIKFERNFSQLDFHRWYWQATFAHCSQSSLKYISLFQNKIFYITFCHFNLTVCFQKLAIFTDFENYVVTCQNWNDKFLS